MSIFDNPNFQLIERVAGKPTITITKNGIGFSKQALSRLNYSHYVKMFINKTDKQIGIRVAGKDDLGAIKFVPEKRDKVDSLRINNPAIKEDLRKLVSKDLSYGDFTCEGEFLEDDGIPALLFDFTKAKPLSKN